MSLRPLLEIAAEDERFRSLARAVREGGSVPVHMSASIQPYLLAALVEAPDGLAGRPVLVVAADDIGARDLARELRAYLAPRRVRYYPSRGTGYASHVAPPPHLVGLRIAALDALTGSDPAVVVASAVALAEAVPDAALRPAGLTLDRGTEVDLGEVAALLVEAGYQRVDQVEERGQFAVRGGILDVFPATEDRAARLELFGDEIESIRWFSTFTQRSLGEADRVELSPAAELASEHRELAELALEDDAERPDLEELLPLESFRAPLELIPFEAAVIITAAEEIRTALSDHWDDVTTAIRDADARRLYVDVAAPLDERASLKIHGIAAGPPAVEAGLSFRAPAPTSAARTIGEAESQLERELRSGNRVVVAFENRGEAERARYNLNRLDARFLDDPSLADPLAADATRSKRAESDGSVLFAEARLSDGFVSADLSLVVIPFRRLVHRRRAAAPGPARGRMAAFTDLRVGDYVVHEDHGIARFAGFETKTVANITRDYLELSYRGSDRVFAPTDQLAKITRYVGTGGEPPQLSALGSARWEGVKARARRAARELAGELLNLYAQRRARRGHAFPPDGEWQLILERSFPYRETTDQLEAIDSVKGDLESERPMDRLICGDVGYGKTEVALRAAQKAVSDGKQVMMLVPTTILAQQHLGTFRERLAEFPIEVEVVSRLRKPAAIRETLAGFAEGKVDILIGTHRLLSRDVRAADLGLLIVDEEQRFGVRQKELLRQLKLKVDVLSMSATPIPRTLQMSLAGVRDISVIETPPEGRRPIRTYVGP
jgi:transcription-repair coupling factor (superfamily II helicase)